MAISLTQVEQQPDGPLRQTFIDPGSVLHFGSQLPPGKRGIVLQGPEVGAHHAKLFYSQGQFWLVNLCGLPCSVRKPSGRAIFLTAVYPATDVEAGDAFQLGNATFVIDALAPPVQRHAAPAATADPSLVAQLRQDAASLDPLTLRPTDDPLVPEAVLRFATDLNQYLNEEEIWRQTVDRLARVFAERWSGPRPVELLVVASGQSGSADSQRRALCALPQAPHEPGESTLPETSGFGADLVTAVGSLPLRDNELFVHRWRSKPGDWIDLLSCPIVPEDQSGGAVALLARWGSAPPPPDTNDLQLFHGLASTASLALTFLRQRLATVEYVRLHDLGWAAVAMAHDECHMIDRVDGLIDDMAPVLEAIEARRVADVRQLNVPLHRIRAVVRYVRATARSVMGLVRATATDRPAKADQPSWQDCGPALRDWLSELDWLTNDSLVELHVCNRLDEQPFWADRDGVLAAARNLHVNACAALRDPQAQAWQLRVSIRSDTAAGPVPGGPVLEYVVLTVGDTGCGIPGNQRGLVFCERIADSASGHGLGSQIVRRVIDAHAGLIRLASRPGVGTHIELWFPRLALSDATLHNTQLTPYHAARERLGVVGWLPDAVLDAPGARQHLSPPERVSSSQELPI